MIDVPVLTGMAERDTVPTPLNELAAFKKATDVSVFIVPRMAHMHNFASTRKLLWERLDGWSRMVARENSWNRADKCNFVRRSACYAATTSGKAQLWHRSAITSNTSFSIRRTSLCLPRRSISLPDPKAAIPFPWQTKFRGKLNRIAYAGTYNCDRVSNYNAKMQDISFPAVSAYHVEEFSDNERVALRPYFTNLDGPVFALTNLPEVVKGALFARYSRSPKSLRRLFLDEFVSNPEIGIRLIATTLPDQPSLVRVQQAESLYRRVFSDYGDDSVAQLGGAHLACEQSSNLLTKVLEWGRLGAYLEQSTRYIRYDQRLGSRWRYYVPPEVESSELRTEFHLVMDRLFSTYSDLASRLTTYFESIYPKGKDSEGVWRATLRAKACDVARGLLPVATMSNVGIYANGQAFESLILRMRSLPLLEAKSYADKMLKELRHVIPAFLARIDVPEKGLAATQYLKNIRESMESLLPHSADSLNECGNAEFSVDLLDWDRDGEEKIIADALYSTSVYSSAELRSIVVGMSTAERNAVLNAYVGNRRDRRHKPGRAFEAANYKFEVVCDYANFRDLQRHRMLTIDWQRITPNLGFSMPGIVADMGAEGAWMEAVNAANELYGQLNRTLGPDVAQYVLPFSTRMRFYIRMNAREAMHFIELRTGKGGHTQYRQVCQRMLELIRDKAGHRFVADAMKFADMVPDYELARLDGERRAERKRLDAMSDDLKA